MKLLGNPVSRGIVIGEVLRYEPFHAAIETKRINEEDIERVLNAYTDACDRAGRELEEMRGRLLDREPNKAKILTAHRDILYDPVIDEEVRGLIRDERMSPDSALAQVFDNYTQLLRKSKNAMMRERATDLQDVKNRLLRCWAGVGEQNLSALEKPVIVVCGELFPSDTASIDRANVLGIVTQTGGLTSHTAIIARSYEIPAVLGVVDCMSHLNDGDRIILDAEKGEVLLLSDGEELESYEAEAERVQSELLEIRSWRCANPVMKDGRRIWVGLNIADANEYELSGASCSDGSGLFRTEFLYLGQARLPDEEKQFGIYKKVLEAFGGKSVTLRTLDIGGDKQLERFNLPPEGNPFLGLRGLRLCLAMPEIFAVQIRAALRASVYGDLRLMLPMVSSLDEIRAAKSFITEQGAALDAEGRRWNRNIKIGIMIEVPSIALIADLVATEVDFVSIGTNDLCQYMNAADRMNPSVRSCYQEYHPAMFRILGLCAREFGGAGLSVGVCGEMGGDILALPAPIGLGIDKFSMGFASLPAVKRLIQCLNMQDANTLAEEVQHLRTESDIRARLREFADMTQVI